MTATRGRMQMCARARQSTVNSIDIRVCVREREREHNETLMIITVNINLIIIAKMDRSLHSKNVDYSDQTLGEKRFYLAPTEYHMSLK